MTTLWLLVAVVAGVGGLVHTARRGGPGRRAARTHHRVLGALDSITRQAGEHPVRAREGDDAHTHVRLVRGGQAGPGAVALRNAPQPGRSLGAAPFRAPVARHTLGGEVAGAPPDAVEEPGAMEEPGAVEEAVRLVPAEGTSPQPPSDPMPEPPAAATVRPELPPFTPAPDGDRPVSGAESHDAAVVRPEAVPPSAGDGHRLHLDTQAPAAEVATPVGPPVSHLPPEAVAALATSGRARRARPPGARAEGQARRSGRHSRRRPRSVVIVGAAAAAAVGIGALGISMLQGGSSPARRSAAPPPVAAPTTTATTTPPPPATLLSSTPQVAVYHLTGPATITFTASSGVSWIELRQGDQSGPVVYEGRLDQGQAEAITGPAWVRLGNPTAVSVAVNRVPITAPALTAGQPYNLEFR